MIINSRALALLCGAAIAAITTILLSLVPDISRNILLTTAVLSFASGFVLVLIMTEFLFFREIDQIYTALRSIRDKRLTEIAKKTGAHANPLRLINKEIHHYADQKQREIDELRKMEMFRREFVADVSHELKTPIFAAQGFVHTLLDGAIEDKTVRTKFLKKAARSLDGLDMLVQDLLTISQMEIGEIKMHRESFDMVELVCGVLDQLEDKAEKKTIYLWFDKHQGPVYVHADYVRISQVMTNLISNALKYTKKGGKVRVLLDENNKDQVVVTVEDSGRGIPEEDLARIFERFYRVDKSRSKDKGGTGLGLSIVKHIMEAHNTTIEVESNVGKGSRFWFVLKKGGASPGPKDTK